jgi:hypothetical protein
MEKDKHSKKGHEKGVVEKRKQRERVRERERGRLCSKFS